MKRKKLKFKLIFLLALGCCTVNNVMAMEVCENGNGSSNTENNSAVKNKDNKPGDNVVEHKDVDNFTYLKGLKVPGDSSKNILIYEHDQTKMKIIIIPHNFFKAFDGVGGFDYYLELMVKNGVMENGLIKGDLKHALEHVLSFADSKFSYFQVFYNRVFGSGNVNDVDNIGNFGASTTESGLKFQCSDLRKLEEVLNQLANPYFKTKEGWKLFNREVKGEGDNYTTGRISSEMFIKNADDFIGGFLGDDGCLSKENAKLSEFFSEDGICNDQLSKNSNSFSGFSKKVIYDGVCEILDEVLENLEKSIIVLPNYVDVPNSPPYDEIMKDVDSKCLSKFKNRVNGEKKHREEKGAKFERKQYELVEEGITGKSAIFDYFEHGEINSDGVEAPCKNVFRKAKDLAYLKVDLGEEYSKNLKDIGWNLFGTQQVRNKVRELGYKSCEVNVLYSPNRSYLIIKFYGNDDSLFKEDRLRATYSQMLKEVLNLGADEIYKQKYETGVELEGKEFKFEEYLDNKLLDLVRNGNFLCNAKGGFDDNRIKIAADEFKDDLEFVKDERYVNDLNYVKEKYIGDINKLLGVLKGIEKSSPEILVLQRPGVGGEEVKSFKSSAERWRNAGSNYEVHLKFKDGTNFNSTVKYYGMKFLNQIGISGELSDCGLFYGWGNEPLQIEFNDKDPEYYLVYPAMEKGGFDKFFKTPEKFKVAVDKILKALNDKDFNKFKEREIKKMENPECNECFEDDLRSTWKEDYGLNLDDLKKMTLGEVMGVIGSVEVEETKFVMK